MITVLFTCHGCGLIDAKSHIRYRRPDEKIEDWMKEVQQQVGLTHSLLSRECKTRCCDLKIPLDSKDQQHGIGMKPPREKK